MALSLGTTLGPYQVTAKIGEGGMGEVWQARDTKLDRDVALKVLPEAFTSDPDRLARFEREAKVLASLNHPNIGSIYGLEEAEGVRALVLELVEGPTLADRIKQGPIPIDEALPIAKQIAEALEAAHERGVIHRDLKPANVKVREDGTVKVLDFGLAKALEGDAGSDPSESPTLTAAATRAGVIMGTAAYMSPEQAKGKTADRRADIWAFGCVLYEMLTGQRPFVGDDVSDTLAAVLRAEVDLDALPDAIPARLRQIVRRCLQKDPKQRLHDVADLRLAMDGAFETTVPQTAEAVVAPALQVWQRPVHAAIAALTLLAIGGLTVWSLTRPAPTLVARFPIQLAADEAFSGTGRPIVAISPNGSHVVYSANNGLSLRPLDQLHATPIPGTDGARNPFFSPDGQRIGFHAAGQLKRVSVSGGAPVTLGEANNPWGASWGADDMILYGQGSQGIWRVPGTGGTPEQLIPMEDGEQAHGPQMLPGGEWVLFTFRPSGASSWDQAQIVVQSLETGERSVVIDGGRDARYVATGHLVYALNGVLLAAPFDLGERRVIGGPVALVEDVSDAGARTGAAQFSLAANGSLVYVPGFGGAAFDLTSRLVVTGRDGAGTPLAEIASTGWYPRYSPDGTRVAFAAQHADGADVWVLDIERGTRTRLTSEGLNRFFPVWSPDGSQLAFAEGAGATNRVLLVSADGSGEPETLLDRDERQFPTSWIADGNVMTIYIDNAATARDLYMLPIDGDLTPELFLATPFQERGVSFPPGGRWVAYVSDESGQDEVYVRPYPGPGGQVIISTGGGEEVVWGPDGSELFYRNGDQVIVVEVTTGQTFSAEAPAPLFAAPYALDNAAGGAGNPNYDISPDGEQFLFVEQDSPTGVEGVAQITVVLNWHKELLERVPVP